VRLKGWPITVAVLLAGAGIPRMPRLAAQEAQVLMPDQSAAKAKQILQQAIQALGGSSYLNVRDSTCTGRLSQFGHSGELEGFRTFVDYAQPPSKARTENLPQRNIIEVYNGDKGWTLDRGGVSDAPPTDLARFEGDTQKELDNILRHRIQEPGMIFRYAGRDVVDLHQVDWVELVDSDDRTIRIAFDQASHLPLRKIVELRDPETNLKTEEIEYFSNFHPLDGIQTPFQITRERNRIKIYQVFFESCQYNTGLDDSLFTRQSLEDRWGKTGKKGKDKKKDKNDKDNNSLLSGLSSPPHS
jgi:outer membrane lipoprotein-sorting protein